MPHKNKEEKLTEEEYFLQRKAKIDEIRSKGLDCYPHKFNVKNSIEEIKEIASECEKEEKKEDMLVESAGRVMSVRIHSKFSFFTVRANQSTIQLVHSNDLYFINSNEGESASSGNLSDLNLAKEVENIKLEGEDSGKSKVHDVIKRGDIIGFTGIPGRTRTNELSVFTKSVTLLAPCLRTIPAAKNSFTNLESIYRKRHLDLIVNQGSRERFITRSRIINFIRNYNEENGFLEVETPVLDVSANGAAARPFKTYHNELKTELFMRIAPELFMKKLVIGGIDRVFEIGKNFRNEGIDASHNPEFTSLEMYAAYWDHNDLILFIENFMGALVKKIKGDLKFTFKDNSSGKVGEQEIEIDFTAPFKKIDILETISEKTGINLTGENIETPEILTKLINKSKTIPGLDLVEPLTITRVLDAYIGFYIEPECINPTFVINHPVVMSPLSKDHRSKKGLTERFELFVLGKELMNGFTELNLPEVQRDRFKMQNADKEAGDDEAMPMDEDFCQALEYGLPPTGGLGIGIDRLVMLLTNTTNIKDVLLFPTMKPENQ